jgi:hypothetical protein
MKISLYRKPKITLPLVYIAVPVFLVLGIAELYFTFNEETFRWMDLLGALNWFLMVVIVFLFRWQSTKRAERHYIQILDDQLHYKHTESGQEGSLPLSEIKDVRFENRTLVLQTNGDLIRLPYGKDSYKANQQLKKELTKVLADSGLDIFNDREHKA